MRLFFNAVLVLALTAMAGCSMWKSPEPVATVHPTVSEPFEGTQIDEANQKAAEYCKARGLEAMLRITSVKDGTQYATYDCIGSTKPPAP
ncbi:MAG: hypothetical protein U1E53_02760 [Dongiaceae bacterium]